jgi:receptor protein-tyrosine kinase
MATPKSHLVERVAERLLQSGALEESAAHLLGPSRAVSVDLGPATRIGRSVEHDANPLPAAPLAAGPAVGPGAGIDLLDRPAAPDDDALFLASPAVLRHPELPPGPGVVDAVALERAGMVDWSRTRSRVSEEFRLVQRQILRNAFAPPGAEPGFTNLIMVTSARPGEGKSFTAINLAGSIARQGNNHVLLVDADSKRDSICYPMGLADAPGLLDLAANPKLDPGPLIVRTPIEQLSILPIGRERERSPVLFSSHEMIRLIQNLGRRYADRLLVLDAPPCLSTSDPAVLAPVVGQVLFVVEAERTQRDEIEASLDLLQACPTIALVLNKQQISSRYTFGAYSSYYSS